MSKIVRAKVTSESKDDNNHMVKITSEGWFKDLLVESVNGLYLRKDDVVFVYIDDSMTMPLILGRATGQLELTDLVNVINKLIDIVNDDKKAFEEHKHVITPDGITGKLIAGTYPVTPVVPPVPVPTGGPVKDDKGIQSVQFADKMDNIEEDDLLKEQ